MKEKEGKKIYMPVFYKSSKLRILKAKLSRNPSWTRDCFHFKTPRLEEGRELGLQWKTWSLSWFRHLPAGWPWVNHLTSLPLGFLIFKREMIFTSQGCCANKIKAGYPHDRHCVQILTLYNPLQLSLITSQLCTSMDKRDVISQNSPGHHWTVRIVRKFCTELNPDLLLPSAALGYSPLYMATSFLFVKRALPPGSAGVLFPRRSTPSSFKGSLYITWLCCPALPLLLRGCISLWFIWNWHQQKQSVVHRLPTPSPSSRIWTANPP